MQINDKQSHDQNIVLTDKNRRKKIIFYGAVILTILIVAIVALYGHEKYHKTNIQKNRIGIQDNQHQNNLNNSWLVNSEGKLGKIAKQGNTNTQQIRQIRKILTQHQTRKSFSNIPTQHNAKVTQSNKNSPFLPIVGRKSYPPSPVRRQRNRGFTRGKYKQKAPVTRYIKLNNLINITQTAPAANNSHNSKQNAKKQKKPDKSSIPAGSFMDAVLLNGIDAPTSGGGQSQPIPILMRVTNYAQLPNKWKSDVRNCFIEGEAKGDLSSERAYIRVDKISCVTPKGKRITKSISGYVTGEDGKVGLAGRVVSKQGAMLARTLAAGFLQGVGQAFQQSQQVVSISPLTGGSTTTSALDSKTMLKMGIGGGVSKATEKLAEFYMNLAKEMFPVVEIDSGRNVNIILLSGVSL